MLNQNKYQIFIILIFRIIDIMSIYNSILSFLIYYLVTKFIISRDFDFYKNNN